MLSYLMLYFGLAAGALAGLSFMILKIGSALADCPDTGRAAKAGSMTIVAGFVTIGAGGVILIAAGVLAVLPHMAPAGVLTALGLAVLCLGLGFTQAVATLRDIVAQAAARVSATTE
ncbi:hypothetical protein [Yoonia maritima]|uniref:hypothetical protein n=1 Tax=Yoonia maritima TaxID=1435347 RepID=UPI003736B584